MLYGDIDFRNSSDTGEPEAAAIQPYNDGEPAGQGVFRRPVENTRSRSDVLRQIVREHVVLQDFQQSLLSGGGTITFNRTVAGGGDGKFTTTADLEVRPFATPGADASPYAASTKASLLVGSTDVIKFESKYAQWQDPGTDPDIAAEADMISVEIAHTGALSVSVNGATTQPNNIYVTINYGTTTCQDVIDAVNAHPGANKLVVASLASGSASNPSPKFSTSEWSADWSARFLRGGAPGLLHTISASVLATFFAASASNCLAKGDTLAIWYDDLVDLATQGGRLQSTPENSNYAISASSLFNTRREPEKIPNCIPICKCINDTTLIFVDGSRIVYGTPATLWWDSAHLSGGSSSLISVIGWTRLNAAPCAHVPPITVQEALDNADDLFEAILNGTQDFVAAAGNHGLKATGSDGGHPGLMGYGDPAGSGAGVEGFGGGTAGVGVYGSGGPNSSGVQGQGGSGSAYGGRFDGSGDGEGVWAKGGATAAGIYGQGGDSATAGSGVVGQGSGNGSGVRGYGGPNPGSTGVYGTTASSGGSYGVLGQGLDGNAVGVYGTGDGSAAGVVGLGGDADGVGVSGTGGVTNGRGVEGHGVGTGDGVCGIGGAADGNGVYGEGQGNGVGVVGNGTGTGHGVFGAGGNGGTGYDGGYGVYGIAQSSRSGVEVAAVFGTGEAYDAHGVRGESGEGGGHGVQGVNNNNAGWSGVSGVASVDGAFGVHGYASTGSTSIGVKGENAGSGPGVHGQSTSGLGVQGTSFGHSADTDVWFLVPVTQGVPTIAASTPWNPTWKYTPGEWTCYAGTGTLYFEVELIAGLKLTHVYFDWTPGGSGSMNVFVYREDHGLDHGDLVEGPPTQYQLRTAGASITSSGTTRYAADYACDENNTGFVYTNENHALSLLRIILNGNNAADKLHAICIRGVMRSVNRYGVTKEVT